jgi:DNA-binding response OmpR family regulator
VLGRAKFAPSDYIPKPIDAEVLLVRVYHAARKSEIFPPTKATYWRVHQQTLDTSGAAATGTVVSYREKGDNRCESCG